MMKEQKKLKEALGDREAVIAHQESELKELRRQNKKLQLSSNKAKLLILASSDDHRDMDTPSSEETSPKSSFSNKTNPTSAVLANKLVSALATTTTATGDNLVSKVQVTEIPAIPPRPVKSSNSGESASSKPPVPSRAGVNRKLQQGPPPVPPARSSSMQKSFEDSGREESDDNLGVCSTETSINNVSTESLVKSDDGFCSSHEESASHR